MSYSVETTTLEPGQAVAIRKTIPVSDLPAFFGGAYHELSELILRRGANFAGPPFARYYSLPPQDVDVEAVMPVTKKIEGAGQAHCIDLEGGRAVQVRHIGPYEAMQPAYEAIADFMKQRQLRAAGPIREIYLTDPSEVPDPAKWETLIVQPVA